MRSWIRPIFHQENTDGVCLRLYQSVKLLLAVSIFFSYAIQFYAVAEIVTARLQTRYRSDQTIGFIATEYGIKLVLILGTCECPVRQRAEADLLDYCTFELFCLFSVAMAQLIPHLALIISLVGSVALSILGLLIPALIETLTLGPSGWGRHRWTLWKNCLLGIYAIFILLSGVYASVRDIVAAREKL